MFPTCLFGDVLLRRRCVFRGFVVRQGYFDNLTTPGLAPAAPPSETAAFELLLAAAALLSVIRGRLACSAVSLCSTAGVEGCSPLLTELSEGAAAAAASRTTFLCWRIKPRRGRPCRAVCVTTGSVIPHPGPPTTKVNNIKKQRRENEHDCCPSRDTKERSVCSSLLRRAICGRLFFSAGDR